MRPGGSPQDRVRNRGQHWSTIGRATRTSSIRGPDSHLLAAANVFDQRVFGSGATPSGGDLGVTTRRATAARHRQKRGRRDHSRRASESLRHQPADRDAAPVAGGNTTSESFSTCSSSTRYRMQVTRTVVPSSDTAAILQRWSFTLVTATHRGSCTSPPTPSSSSPFAAKPFRSRVSRPTR